MTALTNFLINFFQIFFY